jgi:hypothetical protein
MLPAMSVYRPSRLFATTCMHLVSEVVVDIPLKLVNFFTFTIKPSGKVPLLLFSSPKQEARRA